MAKTSMVNREAKRAKLVKKHAGKRAELAVRGLTRGLVAIAPRWMQLKRLIANLEIEPKGAVTMVRWVIGPKRLARWAQAMRGRVVESRDSP